MCTLTWPCAPLQVPPSPQQEPTHCTRSRCVWHGRFCDMEIHGPLLMPRFRASRQAASSTGSTHRASARRRRSAGAVPGSTGRWAGGRRLTRPPATSSRSRGVGDRLNGACGPLAPALRPRALSPRSAEPWLMPACAAANAGMAVGPSPPHAHFAGGRGGWSQRRRPDRPSRAGRRVAGSHDGRITHMGHGVRT